MKRFFYVQIIAAALLLFAGMGTSWAADVGFYGELGSGTGTYTIDFDPGEYDDDYDSSHTGVGFVMDTAAAPEPQMNYRLQVGIETWDINADQGVDADMTGLVVSNDLGFSFTRQSPKVRVWAGPEIKLGYYSGENEVDEDIHVLSYQIGPVLGVNVKLDSGRYFIFKTGYLVGKFDGITTIYDEDYEIWGDISYTFIDVGMLF